MFVGMRSSIAVLICSTLLAACGTQNSTEVSSVQAQMLEGIIGGVPVGEQPQTLASHIKNAGDDMAHTVVALYDSEAQTLCTASIVSLNYLITAAHCVTPGRTGNLRVVYGSDLTQKSGIASLTNVLGAAQAPAWKTNQNNKTEEGDIAIVRLASPVPAGFFPATMLRDAALIKKDSEVLLLGYGNSTGVLDPNSKDKNGLGILRGVVTKITNPSFSSSEFAVDSSQGRTACHGDSGGPAYIRDADGKIYLFGVTSRGTDAHCAKEVVYTNILSYTGWFSSAVAILEVEIKATSQAMLPKLPGQP